MTLASCLAVLIDGSGNGSEGILMAKFTRHFSKGDDKRHENLLFHKKSSSKDTVNYPIQC